MPLTIAVWAILVALVAVEIAILVPVIITQRNVDAQAGRAQLDLISDKFARAVDAAMDAFIFKVSRTAAFVALLERRLTQQDLHTVRKQGLDPWLSAVQTFFYVPRVLLAERADYEAFYGFPVTNSNGTALVPASNRSMYYPYTLIEPPDSSLMRILGFDMLSHPRSVVYLRNVSLHLEPHSSINKTSPNSFGMVIVAQESFEAGYMLGLVSTEDLLVGSLEEVEKSQVVLAAYNASVEEEFQLLFLDDSPLLGNATTVRAFEALPHRQEFVVRTIEVLGDRIMLCMRYDPSYAASFESIQWIILVQDPPARRITERSSAQPIHPDLEKGV